MVCKGSFPVQSIIMTLLLIIITIYRLSDLGDSSNLIGSLFRGL